jgi:hypothetical protein
VPTMLSCVEERLLSTSLHDLVINLCADDASHTGTACLTNISLELLIAIIFPDAACSIALVVSGARTLNAACFKNFGGSEAVRAAARFPDDAWERKNRQNYGDCLNDNQITGVSGTRRHTGACAVCSRCPAHQPARIDLG